MLLLHIHLSLGLFVARRPSRRLRCSPARFELRYSRDARRAQDLTGDLATSVEESALGIRVIKSYGRRPQMLSAFTPDARRLRDAELTKIDTLAWFWALLEGQPQFVLAGVTFGGVFAAAHGAMTLGQLVAFLTLYLRLIWPIISLGWLLALTEEAASACRRIFEVLDTEPTILDPSRPARGRGGATLRFEDVRFRYPDARQGALERRRRAARRRPRDRAPARRWRSSARSGSGKTTLTALVPRLYDVTGGRSRSAASTSATCGSTNCAMPSPPRSRTPRCSRRASTRT